MFCLLLFCFWWAGTRGINRDREKDPQWSDFRVLMDESEHKTDNASDNMDSGASTKAPLSADPATTEELSEFVQNQLVEMQKKLQGMTEHILSRIDQLGSRINDLERNMNDLIEAADVDTESGGQKAAGDSAWVFRSTFNVDLQYILKSNSHSSVISYVFE